jgi:glycosyltransferase involved in cell wall biosynthesis
MNPHMKVALVYDRVNKWGGAERVLLALHTIWPDAPLYTAVYDREYAPWADAFTVYESHLHSMPFARRHHELYPWATPFAFESFSFDEYELVISVTSAEAKGIITKPTTTHICYCLTPTRYLWSGYDQYQESPGWGALTQLARFMHKQFTPILRRWDLIAATRPDAYIAISDRVASRIREYYTKSPIATIHPPVDLGTFRLNLKRPIDLPQEPYFLVVSRLVGHKQLDIVIAAFTSIGWPLIIVGDGVAKSDLKKGAGPSIRFIDRYLTDEELAGYYGNCRAFVFAGEEDFGLSAVEAQACGAPVVAYRESGIAEIITDGNTGILFQHQSKEALVRALKQAASRTFDSTLCRKNVERFGFDVFRKRMMTAVERYRISRPTV